MRDVSMGAFGRCRRGLWVAVWLVWLAVGQAAAQPVREGHAPYFDVRLGVTMYDGERRSSYDDVLREVYEAGGAGIGLEGGWALSPQWSVGAYLLVNRYPYLLYVDDTSLRSIRPGDSSDWIYKVGAVWRRRFHRKGGFSPYLQGGANLAFSLLNERIYVGAGPRVGAGFDVAATRALRLFAELDGFLVAPGDAMDLAGPSAAFDFFSSFGFGLRYDLHRSVAPPPAPARIYNVFGVEALKVGEEGIYAADVRPTGSAPLAFQWDFGDGTTVQSQVATHRYQRPGTYTVTFVASSGKWMETRTFTTVVAEAVVPVGVVAVHTAPLVPRVGEPVTFSPVFSGTGPATCRWDFGDGGRGDGCEATHRYVLPGTYTVLLEARNDAGIARETREVTVQENPCADLTRLHSVHFAQNDDELSVEARGFLRENIARLVGCPSVRIEVRGYAVPGERNGRQLAQERARSVAQYYMNLGIPSGRIHVAEEGHIATVPRGEAVWQYRSVESVPVH